MTGMIRIIEQTFKRNGVKGRIGRGLKGNVLPFLLVIALCLSLSGCGRKDNSGQSAADSTLTGQAVSEESAGAASTFEFELDTGGADESAAETGTDAVTEPGQVSAAESGNENSSGSEDTKETASLQETSAGGALPDENGTYTSKEDVALYIHTYGRLPSNFITKKQAKKLGWSGGSLEEFAPGKCIGGDYFGNYEGLLPEDREYRECDIDTLGKKKRGAKRIIYSDDGYIYYTDDHYESFELLYEP
jgi:hypothetical protein